MKTHVFIFLAAFLGGLVLALALRTARHQPHAPSAPAATPTENHAGHLTAAAPTPPAPEGAKPVNTVCPICGMDIHEDSATVMYKGHVVGLGCAACPPKFAADPDRYGPLALKNQVEE
jgi:hypothetical protein